MEKISFVGVGNMGGPLCERLLKKYKVDIFDLNPTNSKKMHKLGAITSHSLEEVSNNKIIFLCLPTSQDVEKIVLGKNSLSQFLRPDSIIIDMTTGEPSISRRIKNKLSKNFIHFIDAPVSGGPKGAREGTIAIMAGCEKKEFDILKPYLNTISKNVFHAGKIGDGHSIKAGNNLLNLICRMATFEVISLLTKDGVNPKNAIEIIQKSSGRNYATEITLPDNILSGKMHQGFTAALMDKDASIALKNGLNLNIELPLGSLSKELLNETMKAFGNDTDMSNIALTYENKFKIRLRP
tara:strand:- start:1336 stop:2220 length:885 start_codon:yes stop_codon:yes gene_type:complete